jgi:cytochrome c oxidase subunit 1
MPRIRSERPAFEAHYPHLLERLEREAHAHIKHQEVTRDGPRRGNRDTGPGQG